MAWLRKERRETPEPDLGDVLQRLEAVVTRLETVYDEKLVPAMATRHLTPGRSEDPRE